MNGLGKGIAIAGMWIGVGIAVVFQPIATFGFAFATLATVVLCIKW